LASVRRLLSHGFYPFEIPQPFSSKSFGRIGLGSRAPKEFILQKEWKFPSAEIAKHNLARKGKLRRVLGVPNPVVYYNTVREVVAGWSALDAQMATSSISVTRVAAAAFGERALVAENGPPDFPRLRARYRTNRKFLLVADIMQFYPALYTHSIAWALHGKDSAKSAKRDWTSQGNRLDFWVRQSQDQQTRGIPIGPDTSRLLAEVVLVGVDQHLQSRVPSLQGFRAIDDYELSFRTRSEAESALAELQSSLAAFELQLNEGKTDILELPLPLDSSWPTPMRDFDFAAVGTRKKIGSLTEYFGLAFRIAREYPTESVLKYAIVRASSRSWSGATWRTYQDLILQCATAEPGVLQNVIAELWKYRKRGEILDEDRITELAEVIIAEHSPLGHGSEVVWAVWMLVALDLRFTSTIEELVAVSDDPLVPLVVLHGREKGLTNSSLDTSRWEAHMTAEALWGPHWLLAYEAGVRKWLPTLSPKKHHVDQDQAFRFLKTEGVRFYNTRASALGSKKWRPRMTLTKMIGYGF
jgi:hypothetical protein